MYTTDDAITCTSDAYYLPMYVLLLSLSRMLSARIQLRPSSPLFRKETALNATCTKLQGHGQPVCTVQVGS